MAEPINEFRGPTYQSEYYDPSEQDEVIAEFVKLLRMATADGGRKRAAGLKPSWKIDKSHEPAMLRHLGRYWLEPTGVDSDSDAPHLVAVAWRALAQAWQILHPEVSEGV